MVQCPLYPGVECPGNCPSHRANAAKAATAAGRTSLPVTEPGTGCPSGKTNVFTALGELMTALSALVARTDAFRAAVAGRDPAEVRAAADLLGPELRRVRGLLGLTEQETPLPSDARYLLTSRIGHHWLLVLELADRIFNHLREKAGTSQLADMLDTVTAVQQEVIAASWAVAQTYVAVVLDPPPPAGMFSGIIHSRFATRVSPVHYKDVGRPPSPVGAVRNPWEQPQDALFASRAPSTYGSGFRTPVLHLGQLSGQLGFMGFPSPTGGHLLSWPDLRFIAEPQPPSHPPGSAKRMMTEPVVKTMRPAVRMALPLDQPFYRTFDPKGRRTKGPKPIVRKSTFRAPRVLC